MSTYERDPNTGNLNLIDGMRSIDDCKALMLEYCYPVGSFYISTKNVSPQTFLGGTWESRSGYMLRAATSGVNFDNDTNDGGADSVTVSSVANHNHTQNQHSHGITSSAGVNSIASYYGSNKNGSWQAPGSANNTLGSYSITINNATATNIANGSNYTVSTLPKYKNVYMWERTA